MCTCSQILYSLLLIFHSLLPNLVNDLFQYVVINKSKIDPLVVAGIFHKQFVIVHPFIDGNGRTTRLATKMLLAGMGLNTFNLFSFENYYKFRGCIELINKTEDYGFCKIGSGQIIKLVKYNNRWFLDGDLPSGFPDW